MAINSERGQEILLRCLYPPAAASLPQQYGVSSLARSKASTSHLSCISFLIPRVSVHTLYPTRLRPHPAPRRSDILPIQVTLHAQGNTLDSRLLVLNSGRVISRFTQQSSLVPLAAVIVPRGPQYPIRSALKRLCAVIVLLVWVSVFDIEVLFANTILACNNTTHQ